MITDKEHTDLSLPKSLDPYWKHIKQTMGAGDQVNKPYEENACLLDYLQYHL